jgi:hypothetical protein
MYNINMEVSCKKGEVLGTLKKNREEHVELVEDSRRGYIEKAKRALVEKMDAVAQGKIVALRFNLHLPVDHTAEYDTAIRMLEMHTEDTIKLSADEVRCLIENKWDWMQDFIAKNEVYSPLFETKGISVPEEY